MTSGFYGPEDSGSSPFDDFLARIYGTGGPRQPVHRVDITRLMSAPARELLSLAATHAAEQGGRDLDTEQFLWAAANMEPTRSLLAQAGADPDALAREIESQEAGAGPSGEPPQLTPRGQARPAGRAPDLPRGRFYLHRSRAHPVRPGRQPRVRRGPHPVRGPGHPRDPAAGPDRSGRRGWRPQRSGWRGRLPRRWTNSGVT